MVCFLQVGNILPSALLKDPVPGTCNVGDKLEFDASPSKDDDGYIIAYEWSEDGGKTFVPSSAKYTFTCASAGEKVLLLKVKDNNNEYSAYQPVNIQV